MRAILDLSFNQVSVKILNNVVAEPVKLELCAVIITRHFLSCGWSTGSGAFSACKSRGPRHEDP